MFLESSDWDYNSIKKDLGMLSMVSVGMPIVSMVIEGPNYMTEMSVWKFK